MLSPVRARLPKIGRLAHCSGTGGRTECQASRKRGSPWSGSSQRGALHPSRRYARSALDLPPVGTALEMSVFRPRGVGSAWSDAVRRGSAGDRREQGRCGVRAVITAGRRRVGRSARLGSHSIDLCRHLALSILQCPRLLQGSTCRQSNRQGASWRFFVAAVRVRLDADPASDRTHSIRRNHLLVLAIVLACIVAVVQASFFEWAFHRYWLHRPWLPKDCFTTHTLIHHQLCKFDDTFHVVEEEQHEALSFAWWGGPTLILINLLPWSLAAWGLSAAGVSFPYTAVLVAGAVTFLIYYIGYEGFHYLMHKPTIRWIEQSRPFRFLERHHRVHHIHMDRNLNV